ncbi:MAG: Fe-only nitrogenase accessory protein AnfO [Clostridiaceae bacterium]
MEIAVLINTNGESISFNESGVIKVYSNADKDWRVIKELPFEVDNVQSPKELRDLIKKSAESLDTCKVFVAKEVKGLPYTIFDGLGFNIWQLEGLPKELLDYIYEKEEEEKAKKLKPVEIPVPIINGKEGHYFIDLKTELHNNEALTSKKVLLPFLNNTSFEELEIICGHIPPWFNGEFKRLNLKSESEQLRGNTFKVIVYPIK